MAAPPEEVVNATIRIGRDLLFVFDPGLHKQKPRRFRAGAEVSLGGEGKA
jgi:hypothetical protein